MGSIEPSAHRLGLLLLPDFSNLGLAAVIEPLFIANWLMQRTLFEWSVLSIDGLSVKASNGMRVPVDAAISDDSSFQTILVLASFDVKRHAQDQRVINWLRRMSRHGAELGGIETGSEVLAAAGLMDGHPTVVHWDNLEGFRERYPDVEATANLYNIADGRMTSSGGTATLDMMLNWIGRRVEPELVEEVAHHLILSRQRPALQEQGTAETDREAISNRVVSRALQIMHESIEEPVSCRSLARDLGLSLRQLQRLFRRHLGTTVKGQYQRLRLSKAHKLLQQTDLSVTEVAVSAGYVSLRNFSRIYRRTFGRSPSGDRRQSTTAPVLRPAGRR